MLFLIGLGLWDEKDLSLKAIEAMKICDKVYCESYTANWSGNLDEIEKLTGKKIEMLRREDVESEFLVEQAKEKNVALLAPGDPLVATTHFQLLKDAKDANVKTKTIHSSSIYTAVAQTGLSIYKFGRTTTLAYPEKGYAPESPYHVILENRKHGLHTLVLLDTKQNGMTIKDGLKILWEIDKKRKGEIMGEKLLAAANMGSENPTIKYDYAENLQISETGVLVILGKTNANEEEALQLWQ